MPQRDPWRQSLRASRERRAAAFRRRRRRLRGRTGAAVACATLTFLAGGALAAPAGQIGGDAVVRAGATGSTVVALQSALGIPADGVFGPQTRAAVKRFQRANGLAVDGIAGPATLAALGVRATTAAVRVTKTSSAPTALLARIAECESDGDPTAVSAGGAYRGKYQFSRATWRAMGGRGDPAAAPEAEQDRRAQLLLRRQGPSAWPNCAG